MDADTSQSLSQIIQRRRSLRSFSPRAIDQEVLGQLFEAARWAASAFNEQPWRYVVLDGEAVEQKRLTLDCMEPHNRAWAEKAPVVLASVARTRFSHKEGPNRHAFHDVGQANAHLALKAAELGLAVHQIAGFDVAAAGKVLGIPAEFEVVALIVVGYPGSPDALPEPLKAREVAPRSRRDIEDFVFRASYDTPAFPAKQRFAAFPAKQRSAPEEESAG